MIVAISLIVIVVGLIFAFDLTPWVRGGFGWRWPYLPLDLAQIVIFALLTMLFVLGGYLIYKGSRRALYVLMWSLVWSVLLSVTSVALREGDALYALLTRTTSIVSSGEFWMGQSVDWRSGDWRDWTAEMTKLGQVTSNAATSPPGLPMLFGLSADILRQSPRLSQSLYVPLLPHQCHNYNLLIYTPAQWGSAWLGILTPLWSALTVFPLFIVSKHITRKTDPRLPVLFWPIVPGIAAFGGSSSTLFPLLALMAFLGLLLGTQLKSFRARVIANLLGGFVYGIGVFLNLVFLPIAPLYILYLLMSSMQEHDTHNKLMRFFSNGIIFAIGALIPWAIWFALTTETPIDILQTSLQYHLTLERPYWYWVWMHVWDWAIWSGLPLFLIVLYGIFRWFRKRTLTTNHTINKMPTLSIALLGAVLIWTISGTTRAESGRIWLVLTPFLIIAATELAPYFLPPNNPVYRNQMPLYRRILHLAYYHPWRSIFAGQGLLFIILITCLNVFSAPDMNYPPQAPDINLPHEVNVEFKNSQGALYRLIGWDASAREGEITLLLRWQGVARPLEYQWFSTLLVSPNGQVFPTDVWQPSTVDDQSFPTTCWAPSRQFVTETVLRLPEASESGNWYISLAVFGDAELPEGRLTVHPSDGTIDSQVGIGPILVP